MAGQDLTIEEFAKLTNTTPRSVQRRIREGKIPTYRLGESRRIRAEVAEAIRAGKPIPTDIVELDAYIDAVVAEAPPLTSKQVMVLSALFDWPPAEATAEIRDHLLALQSQT